MEKALSFCFWANGSGFLIKKFKSFFLSPTGHQLVAKTQSKVENTIGLGLSVERVSTVCRDMMGRVFW